MPRVNNSSPPIAIAPSLPATVATVAATVAAAAAAAAAAATATRAVSLYCSVVCPREPVKQAEG